MNSVELLEEITQVMRENPERGFVEFEHRHFEQNWMQYVNWKFLLIDALKCPELVRRRPRMIQVSGEVPEELTETVRRVAALGTNDGRKVARALLDLIEQSGGE